MLVRLGVFLAVLLWSLPAAAQSPTDSFFVFHLDGPQVVPADATTAFGGCVFAFDAGASDADIACVHDLAGATSIAIHRGAAGVSGAVEFDLGSAASPIVTTWSGMTPTQIADLLAGNYYVEAVAGGTRIRGQVLPRTVDTVSFAMAGTQVTPPTGSGATGSCSADLDSYPVSLAVNCTHGVASPASAHVHAAPFGDDGSVVYTFASPASPFAAGVPLGMVDIASFAAGFLYADVHSALFPDGEIRGQIDDDVPAPPAPETTFSVASATSTGTISGSISGGGSTCSIDTVSATTASAAAGGGPKGVTFEHGLVDIRLTGCLAGDAVTFTIVYPDAIPAGASFWKWGPAPDDATPHWYTIPATIVGDTVEYTITDGDLGDDDLLENGVIEDPGGPGVATAVPAMPGVLLVIFALGLFLLVGRRAAIGTAR